MNKQTTAATRCERNGGKVNTARQWPRRRRRWHDGKRQVYVANAIIIKLFFNLNSNVMEQQPNECSAHFGRHLTIWRLEMTQHGQRGRRSIDATNVISTQTHTERERGGKRAHNVRVHCMSSVYWRELKKLVGENLCLRTI